MNSDIFLSNPGASSGPNVVLIHGYGADQLTWLATTPSLLKRANIWLLDLPGHGQSERDCGDGSLSTMVERVRSSLHKAGLSRAHLVGHSLGGRISMELAVQSPELVQSLFLISPAGVGGSINAEFLRSFHDATDEHSIVDMLRMLVHDPRMISRSLGKRVLNYLEQDGTRLNLQRIASGLVYAQSEAHTTVAHLKELDIPCCSLWGQEDQINPPDPNVTGQLPGKLHLLTACGHLPHLEHSVTVNRLLREFHNDPSLRD